MYADDTTLSARGNNVEVISTKLTLKWSRYWALPLVVKGGPYGS